MAQINLLPTERPAHKTWNNFLATQQTLCEMLEILPDYYENCPDFPQLRQKQFHYVFIYDSMKKGHRRHRELFESQCIGVGTTVKRLRMYKEKIANGYNPIVTFFDREHKEDNLSIIYGEVYKVSPEKLMELDWAHNNLNTTTRIKQPVNVIIDQDGTTERINCYSYIGRRSYYEAHPELLFEMPQLKANKDGKMYYNFRPIDNNTSH